MSEPEGPGPNGNQAADELQVLDEPLAQPEPTNGERQKRGRSAHRRYFLWMRLSRLTLGAFVLLGAVVVLWLIPWLPAGLDTSDYTPQMAFTIYLLAGIAIVGLLLLSFQELARRDREILSAWATVYDEATGLHNRTYFYDRLLLECERAKQSPEPFSVIVLQFHALSARAKSKTKPPLSSAALERIAELINGATHPTDLVGLLSGSELVLLAVRVDRGRRRMLQERLETTVAAALVNLVDEGGDIDVRSGGATYGVDGTQAGGLIQAARTSAALGVRQRLKAA